MPSMKWIREKANAFLDCLYPYGAKDRLAHARYEQNATIVSELVSWLETYDKMDRLAKKNNETKRK